MNTLFKATVREFYRQRAGFFLAVLLLAFGFLSAREHLGIALFFLTDRLGMGYLALIWGLYALMTQVFRNTLWASPEYRFVYNTRLVPLPQRLAWLGGISAGLMAPALLYGVWIIRVAVSEDLFYRSLPVFAIWALTIAALTASSDRQLRNQDTALIKKKIPVALRFRRPASPVFWTIEWLIREKGLTLLLCKSGAALFTVATMLYYGTDEYDIRLPAVGLSMAVLANIGLSYEIFIWESETWLWQRSLPVPFRERCLRIVLLHFILLAPDFLLAARYGYPLLNFAGLLQLYALQLGFLLWYHSTLYKKKELVEESLGVVFRMFIALTLLILYKVPLIVLATAFTVYGGWNYYRWTK